MRRELPMPGHGMTGAMRSALIGIVGGAMLILVAFASAWTPGGAPEWGIWSMIVGSALVLSATLALGALRSGMAGGRAALLAAFLWLVILAGFGLPVILPAETPDGPMLLGLPLRAAIEVFGVGVLPLVVLPVAFAALFRADGLDPAALERLRRRAAELHREPSRPDDA